MTDTKVKLDSVKFWKSRVNAITFRSHAAGLNKDQLEFLQSLTVGDKLILFINNDDTINLRKDKPHNAAE